MERSGALEDAAAFLDHFEDLADPRQAGKVTDTLDEVLLLCLLAVLAGAESVVDSTREIGAKTETETRLDITSLDRDAETLGPTARSHWAIENSLHWVMDMAFRDDECRLRTKNAPANFATLKHMALNLVRRAPGTDSLRVRRKVAAEDDDFLASLLSS